MFDIIFNLIAKLFKTLTGENLVIFVFTALIFYLVGYGIGYYDERQNIKQELIEKDNAHKKEIIKKTEDYNSQLAIIEKKYIFEIEKLKNEHKELINKLDIYDLNMSDVKCLHDNKIGELRESTAQDECNVICINRAQLLQRVERSLDIAKDCEEEHKKLKYLLKNCDLNAKFR